MDKMKIEFYDLETGKVIMSQRVAYEIKIFDEGMMAIITGKSNDRKGYNIAQRYYPEIIGTINIPYRCFYSNVMDAVRQLV